MSRFVLDCANTRPVDAQVRGWWAAAQERAWASPTATYHEGRQALNLLWMAAPQVAGLTGGADAWFAADRVGAVHQVVAELAGGGRFEAVATTAVDAIEVQQSVHNAAAALGLRPVIADVEPDGRIALAGLEAPTILVTHAANPEIGVVQRPLGSWRAQTGSAVVLDASCALGWIDLPDDWDALVLDPRAWGAPAGVCAVVEATGGSGPPRSDCGNVPAAATAAAAGMRWMGSCWDDRETARAQIGRIRSRVLAEVPDVDVHGGTPADLPHVVSISVLYVDGEALQTRLDRRGYAVGSGSACAARSGQPSHVLAAIGGLTSGNVRIGLPPQVPDAVIDGFIDAFVEEVAQVRSEVTGWTP